MAQVSIVSCDNYSIEKAEMALNEAINAVNGFDFIKSGMKIAIKANLVSTARPENAATTHPALLCALVTLLRDKGCSVVIGDSPGGLYNPVHLDRIYSITGMKQVITYGAELNDNFRHSQAHNPNGLVAKSFEYTTYLDDADAIINFCKLKTHGMMSMSAAVKNMFGVVPGTFKPEYHYRYPDYKDFANMLIDLNEYFHPSLCITDAVIGMEGNGPTMGAPRGIGVVTASQSPYLLDLLNAAIIGLEPDNIPTLVEASKRGLLPADLKLEHIDIYGDYTQYVISDYKTLGTKSSLQFNSETNKFLNFISPLAAKCLKAKPALHSEECIGCEKCANICPAKAIKMKSKGRKKIPVIIRAKCICCFCCQEFCPKGALKVSRPFIARLLNHTK